MRKIRYNSYKLLLAALVLGSCVVSCNDDELVAPEVIPETNALQLTPSIFKLDKSLATGPQTRADGDEDFTVPVDALHENYMGNQLDVFIEGVEGTSFWKDYHFTDVNGIKEQLYLLEKNWRNTSDPGYDANGKYKAYVVVNNPAAANITTLEGLKAAVLEDDNIFTQYTTRQLSEAETSEGYYTNTKVFPMDGVLNWDFSDHTTNKELDVYLKRAAVKIVLDLSFTDEFKEQLEDDEKTIGTPMSRSLNFNYKTPAIQDGNAVDPNLKNGWLIGVPKVSTEDYIYRLITYSYAFDWSDDVLEKAPGIVISVGYNHEEEDGTISSEINYYRIPITATNLTKFERNHVYHINAAIGGYGAITENTETEPVVKLKYEVLPWTDGNEITVVQVDADVNFLMVTPTEDKMFGANAEDAIIQYYAAAGANVKVRKDEVYYYDASGNKINASSGSSGSSYWKGATISDPSNGEIKVRSDVLENKAVKFIKFTVYLDNDNNNQPDPGTKSYTVTVKHFPLDNIQNISGKWSSKTRKQTTTEYVYTLEEAEAWGSDYTTETGEFVLEEYVNYSTYNSNPSHYKKEGPEQLNWNPFGFGNWPNGTHNSEATAVSNVQGSTAVSGDGWFYYRTGTIIHTYYRVRYSKKYTTRYSRTVETYDTTTWTDYEYRTGPRWYSTVWNDGNAGFAAKYSKVDNGQIYFLKANGDQSNSTYERNIGDLNTLSNNHMYVIQITETSTEYTIGRPKLNNNFQSQDNVASPAFMIASQLGAVLSDEYDGTTAAQHCNYYMEVELRGTEHIRYTGWRLPTRAEIGVIMKYQNEGYDTIDEVLSGERYWSLQGQQIVTSNQTVYTGTGDGYVRCVRDLTPEEVEYLNNKSN